jgi:hypothetical protein
MSASTYTSGVAAAVRRGSPRRGLWLALALAALLGVAEGGVRLVLGYVSQDLRHIGEIPRIAERLGEASGLRVLFLGNSLTRTDIDPAVFEQTLAGLHGGRVASDRVHPDDTKIGEWYYTLKNYFIRAGHAPDVVVLGFVGRQVEDFGAIEPSRLATSYGGLGHAGEFFREDIPDFGGRVEFLLSSFSVAFAQREKVKNRLLAAVVPYYDESATRVNRTLQKNGKEGGTTRTYRRLEKLVDMAAGSGVHLVLISMPQPEPYPVDEDIFPRLRAKGMTYIDCRTIEGLRAEHFPDGYHLRAEGARIFSRELAHRMAGVMQAVTHAKGLPAAGSKEAI